MLIEHFSSSRYLRNFHYYDSNYIIIFVQVNFKDLTKEKGMKGNYNSHQQFRQILLFYFFIHLISYDIKIFFCYYFKRSYLQFNLLLRWVRIESNSRPTG